MFLHQGRIKIAGTEVFYAEGGGGFPVLLIHGSGPGASTASNWQPILKPMTDRYHVFVTDLIGFGQSGRKTNEPYFDLELWLEQCRQIINLIPGQRIGVLGHSLSGALALKLASREKRISAVLTTGTLGSFPD